MNHSVFDAELRRTFPDVVETVLRQVLNDPDIVLDELGLLSSHSAASTVSLTDKGPSAVSDSPATLFEDFLDQVKQTPDAPALVMGDHTYSYAELGCAVDAFATRLVDAGVQPGDTVLLCIPRSAEAVIGLLAIWQCAAAFVPVDIQLPALRLTRMFNTLKGAAALGQEPKASSTVVALTTHGLPQTLVSVLRETGISTVQAAVPAVLPTPSDVASSGLNAEESTRCLDTLAYVLFTSGSTGDPKGVAISHGAIANYVRWAKKYYVDSRADVTHVDFALFTSMSVDLTLTSVLLPLVVGGTVRVYPPSESSFDTLVREVVADKRCNFIKVTPSHLEMLSDELLVDPVLQCVIVGGERFAQTTAQWLHEKLGDTAAVYNEYGPTEATVGCIVHRYQGVAELTTSVPIGEPISNLSYLIVDRCDHVVPHGVRGELLLCGDGLAHGYLGDAELTRQRFVALSHQPGLTPIRVYRTGDLASVDHAGVMHYHGRIDTQVKLRGVRLEIGEIEAVLTQLPWVNAAAARVVSSQSRAPQLANHRCVRCALPENYPGADLDATSVCSICRRYEKHRARVEAWFGDMQTLVEIAVDIRKRHARRSGATGTGANCVALISGGKDSTYMLYRLKALGLTPLVLTLDNGYLSQHALANVQRAVADLDLPHRFVGTPHMAQIFADSLVQHGNVCNGCFKTIYTLALEEADRDGIDVIFTGLSRGQLFETRLNDLYDQDDIKVEEFDAVIETARSAYHAMNDEVSRCLGRRVIEDNLLERIKFVDFYRYVDVPLDEVMTFLAEQTPWKRPPDTGRSTNCLINEAGIFVHKQTRGYHNYDLPYSWDVRIGHKTREQALDELTETIDPAHANAMLSEVGFTLPHGHQTLIAGVVTEDGRVSDAQRLQLQTHIEAHLPEVAQPSSVVGLAELPTAASGKLDEAALARLCQTQPRTVYQAPVNDIEKQILDVWQAIFDFSESSDVNHANRIGTTDNFFALGGDSLLAVRMVMGLREAGYQLSPTVLFDHPTVAALAEHVQSIAARGDGESALFDPATAGAVSVEISDSDLSDIAGDLAPDLE